MPIRKKITTFAGAGPYEINPFLAVLAELAPTVIGAIPAMATVVMKGIGFVLAMLALIAQRRVSWYLWACAAQPKRWATESQKGATAP